MDLNMEYAAHQAALMAANDATSEKDRLGHLARASSIAERIGSFQQNLGAAAHILDLGPDGGVRGGEVVAQGTPEEVAATPASYTGQYLKPMLSRAQKAAD